MAEGKPFIESHPPGKARRIAKQLRYERILEERNSRVENRHRKSARIRLRPLSKTELPQAIAAARSVFTEPEDLKKLKKEYQMSLDRDRFKKAWDESGFISLKYWFVTKTKKSDDIVGITGLEQRKGDPDDIAWLGWFGTVPEVRRKGFGRALLKKTITKARSLGFERLRLWTTTSPNEIAAQAMYEEFGFVLVESDDPASDHHVLFREKIL